MNFSILKLRKLLSFSILFSFLCLNLTQANESQENDSDSSLASFFSSYSYHKDNNGQVTTIRSKQAVQSIDIIAYLETLRDLILSEKNLRAQDHPRYTHSYREELVELLFDGDVLRAEFDRSHLDRIEEAIEKILTVDFDAFATNPKVEEVVKKFEVKLKDIALKLDPTVIAKLDDSRFFWHKNLTHQATTFGLKLAKRLLKNVALLNTASFAIVEFEKIIRNRRLFQQNKLLYYLENYPENELGLTKEEADHAFSSIYESRIPWYAFWSSNQAKSSWHRYGTDQFYKAVRQANKFLYKNTSNYDLIGKRLSYSFVEVEKDSKKMIVNLSYPRFMFSKLPSIAYHYSSPKKVTRARALLQLGKVGLSFLGLPSFIQSPVNSFIDSTYREQVISEGALTGYFESQSKEDMILEIKKQSFLGF